MKPINFLHVDDCADYRMLVQLALRTVPGVRLVHSAPDGAAAIRYLDRQRRQFPAPAAAGPQVVVLDLHMPKYDGFEVLTWLKGLDRPPKAVVLTDSQRESDRELAISLGVDDYQIKPLSFSALVVLLTRLAFRWGSEEGSVPPDLNLRTLDLAFSRKSAPVDHPCACDPSVG